MSPKCGRTGSPLKVGAKSQTTWGPGAAFLMVLGFCWVQLGLRSGDSGVPSLAVLCHFLIGSPKENCSVSELQFLHL